MSLITAMELLERDLLARDVVEKHRSGKSTRGRIVTFWSEMGILCFERMWVRKRQDDNSPWQTMENDQIRIRAGNSVIIEENDEIRITDDVVKKMFVILRPGDNLPRPT